MKYLHACYQSCMLHRIHPTTQECVVTRDDLIYHYPLDVFLMPRSVGRDMSSVLTETVKWLDNNLVTTGTALALQLASQTNIACSLVSINQGRIHCVVGGTPWLQNAEPPKTPWSDNLQVIKLLLQWVTPLPWYTPPVSAIPTWQLKRQIIRQDFFDWSQQLGGAFRDWYITMTTIDVLIVREGGQGNIGMDGSFTCTHQSLVELTDSCYTYVQRQLVHPFFNFIAPF